MVRREVKHLLMESECEDDFVHLAFTTEETQTLLHWEHAGEFEYQGEMYDLVRTETRNDSVFYTLWWDHDETALNQKLAALTKTRQGESNPAKERQLIDDFKVYPPSAAPAKDAYFDLSQTTEFYYRTTFLAIYLSVESPPPEYFIS